MRHVLGGRHLPGPGRVCSSKKSVFLPNLGHEKQIDPETFKDFYNCWKEAEAEAQEVSLPLSVMEHLDKNECVYKLSSSVKTNRGVGKIAMTQKRLFLLTEGRPGYVEISTFRNIEVRAGSRCLPPGGPSRADVIVFSTEDTRFWPPLQPYVCPREASGMC